MSKNITIQEGGLAKQLTANKLKTSLVGGGTCLWVPEDETNLTTKYITENGTYRAASEGYYGYSEVTVSGVGSVTGRDGDGDDATVGVNEDGDIVITKLPSKIVIETLPLVTSYQDGQEIGFTGMTVKAYTASGAVWSDNSHPNGNIPISELVFPVTVADASQVSGETSEATSDIVDGAVPMGGKIVTQNVSNWGTTQTDYTYSAGAVAGKTDPSNNWAYVLFASGISGAVGTEAVFWRWIQINPDYESVVPYPRQRTYTNETELDNVYTYEGRTAYYAVNGYSYGGAIEKPPESNVPFDGRAAWTILYGTITTHGGTQNIPVNWNRPGDNEELSTSFEITVTDSLGGASGGGGQAGETGAGRND